ncbi:MAG: hypothetical protein AB7H93_08375 [Vicinamibacterales bacterium]
MRDETGLQDITPLTPTLGYRAGNSSQLPLQVVKEPTARDAPRG